MNSVSTLREESRERQAAPQTLRLLLANVPCAGALLGLHGVLLADALGGVVAHAAERLRPGRQVEVHHLPQGQGLVGGGDPLAHCGGTGGHQAVEGGGAPTSGGRLEEKKMCRKIKNANDKLIKTSCSQSQRYIDTFYLNFRACFKLR